VTGSLSFRGGDGGRSRLALLVALMAGVVMGETRTGIEGTVSLRPVRPVQRKGAPGSRPYEALITIVDAGGHEIASVQSDAEGKFAVALPPGTYVVRPEARGMYPRASDQRVTVRANVTTHVDVVYDSGIR
jgi:hypothetical protein